MSSIGVVVFRNQSLGTSQVLQESVNNTLNISNNDINKNGKREIIIVRKKQKIQSPLNTVSVTSLVRAADPIISNVPSKKLRFRESSGDEARAPTPLSVARRNARERNRVRQVNDGFAALRSHIPDEVAAVFETANTSRGPNKKLSKVETLRMAVEYIRNLECLLNIGHNDKENSSLHSMESYPSPASSSPRENSHERSCYSINSPALEDDDFDDNDQHPRHQYVELPGAETFQLVSTPHLYEEEDCSAQPMTPSSDLLGQEDVNPQLLESHFPFPSAEQFSVIPDQVYSTDIKVPINDNDYELKYAETLHQHLSANFDDETSLSFDGLNAEMILNQGQFKFKEEDAIYVTNQGYSDVELKKEIPDIHVTPEDRAQFEETLKWWQEKTRKIRPVNK